MMRKLRIVLCLAVTGCILAEAPNARADNSGVLKGRFVYAGSPPKRNKLVVNKDQDVCGAFNLLDEQLVVAEDGAIKDVAIYARKLKGDAADQSNEPVVLDNKDCRFASCLLHL